MAATTGEWERCGFKGRNREKWSACGQVESLGDAETNTKAGKSTRADRDPNGRQCSNLDGRGVKHVMNLRQQCCGMRPRGWPGTSRKALSVVQRHRALRTRRVDSENGLGPRRGSAHRLPAAN